MDTATAIQSLSQRNASINEVEEIALKSGYFNNYLDAYFPLKLKREKYLDTRRTDEEKRLNNAIGIYVYAIFENLWYGYLMGNSDSVYLIFNDQTINLKLPQPYLNHLPSFSSAILNFGTCRDLFFILLNLCIRPNLVANKEGICDLMKPSSSYRDNPDDEKRFAKDLGDFSAHGSSYVDTSFVDKGIEILKSNKFRNFFAHKLRLLWWINNNQTEFSIPKDFYE